MAQVFEAVGMIRLLKMLDQALLGKSLEPLLKDKRLRALFVCCLQWSPVHRMHRSLRVLATLVLVPCAGNVDSTLHKGYTRQSRLLVAPSLPQRCRLYLLLAVQREMCPDGHEGIGIG